MKNQLNLKKCSVHHLFVFLAKTFLRLLMSASIGFFFLFFGFKSFKGLDNGNQGKIELSLQLISG